MVGSSDRTLQLVVKMATDTRQLSQGMQQANTRLSAFGNSVKTMVKGAGLIAAAYGGVRLFGSAIEAAKELEESTDRVGNVFRESTAEIDAWAENLHEAYRMSNRETQRFIGEIGLMARSVGAADSVIVGMSTSLLEAAADLASFNDVSQQRAVQAMTAALSGEAEALKRLGINVTQAFLKEDIERYGLQELSRAEQYTESILKQMDRIGAAGDSLKTADSATARQTILQKKLDDALTELGKQTLPIYVEVVNFAVDALQLFTETAGFLDEVILKPWGSSVGTLHGATENWDALAKAVNSTSAELINLKPVADGLDAYVSLDDFALAGGHAFEDMKFGPEGITEAAEESREALRSLFSEARAPDPQWYTMAFAGTAKEIVKGFAGELTGAIKYTPEGDRISAEFLDGLAAVFHIQDAASGSWYEPLKASAREIADTAMGTFEMALRDGRWNTEGPGVGRFEETLFGGVRPKEFLKSQLKTIKRAVKALEDDVEGGGLNKGIESLKRRINKQMGKLYKLDEAKAESIAANEKAGKDTFGSKMLHAWSRSVLINAAADFSEMDAAMSEVGILAKDPFLAGFRKENDEAKWKADELVGNMASFEEAAVQLGKDSRLGWLKGWKLQTETGEIPPIGKLPDVATVSSGGGGINIHIHNTASPEMTEASVLSALRRHTGRSGRSGGARARNYGASLA